MNSFKYHLRDAWRLMNIRKGRSIWSTILLFFTSIVTSIMFMFLLTEIATSNNIKNSMQIRVSVDANASKKQTQTLSNQLATVPNVKSIKYSSKEDEYQKLIKEEGSAFKIDSSIDGTPTLAVFYVKLNNSNDLAKTANKMRKLPFVDHVNANIKNNNQTKQVLQSGMYLILSIEAIFLLLTFFRLKRNTKFNIELEKNIIRRQLKVGALHKYIKAPFIYQSVLSGLIGSILSIIGIVPIYLLAYGYLNGQANNTIAMNPPLQAIFIVWGETIVVITLFCWLAAKFSVRIKEKIQSYN